MTATAALDAPADAPVQGLARTNAWRAWGLLAACALLLIVVVASLATGARGVPFASAFRALFAPDGSLDHRAIREIRLPRTFAGVLVGAAMGLAGALIQAMTRNPLADPGVLGINAGASFMLVIAVVFVGLTSAAAFVWFSFAGALGAMVFVYVLGSVGRGGATPERLAVAGIAFAAAVGGSTTVITFLYPASFRELTRWTVGSIADPHPTVFTIIMPFVLVGAVIAMAVARPLNAVALGDDLARALGANIGRVRLAGVVAVTLLAGGGTSAGGPVAFVGFVVPHVARRICGPDQRWVFAYTVVLSPVVVLVADIVGRTIVRPDELPVGVVTAFVGAPMLIYVVRRRRVVQL